MGASMKAVLLWSGGKDSYMAYRQAKQQDHEIICLATFSGDAPFKCHDLRGIMLQSRALRLPGLVRRVKEPYFNGYKNALRELLESLEIECAITGDIGTPDNNHENWMEEVCCDIGLKLVKPLFGIDRKQHLKDLLKYNVSAIITCVSKEWFGPEWVGRSLDSDCIEELLAMGEKGGFDACGEDGEYHTFVVDSDEFTKKIIVSWSGISETNGLWYMKSKDFALAPKNLVVCKDLQ